MAQPEIKIGPDNINGNSATFTIVGSGNLVIELDDSGEMSLTPVEISNLIRFIAPFADPRHL